MYLIVDLIQQINSLKFIADKHKELHTAITKYLATI